MPGSRVIIAAKMDNSTTGEHSITCPRCRAAIETTGSVAPVKFCPFCGEKLLTPPPASPPKKGFCPSCGRVLSAPFDFCPSCGAQLTVAPAAAVQPDTYEEPPPTPAELASAQKAASAVGPATHAENTRLVTDPKLKKLYKQWAAYAELPEESLPVMERPRPVQPHKPQAEGLSGQVSSIIAGIPPLYIFIAAAVIVFLVLVLIIVIVA